LPENLEVWYTKLPLFLNPLCVCVCVCVYVHVHLVCVWGGEVRMKSKTLTVHSCILHFILFMHFLYGTGQMPIKSNLPNFDQFYVVPHKQNQGITVYEYMAVSDQMLNFWARV
jgi:hypothetical protein